MDELIPKKIALDALRAIIRELWGIYLRWPESSTEHMEYHELIRKMIEFTDMEIKKINDIKMEGE